MNEEEINKMCSDIYEGEDWQPMKDYIKSLQTQLQQKDKELEARKQLINKQDKELWTLEHITKEIREKIKEFCWDYDYETYSNMTSNEVKELVEILDKALD